MQNKEKQLNLIEYDIPNEKLAYLAGIIDGEGCIHINTRDNQAYSYQLSITSTDLILLDWIKEIFGGKIYGPFKGKSNKQYFYTWHAHGLLGKQILELTLPFLIIKNKSAQAFIEAMTISSNNTTRIRPPHIKRHLNKLVGVIQASHSSKGKKTRTEDF